MPSVNSDVLGSNTLQELQETNRGWASTITRRCHCSQLDADFILACTWIVRDVNHTRSPLLNLPQQVSNPCSHHHVVQHWEDAGGGLSARALRKPHLELQLEEMAICTIKSIANLVI